MTYDPVHHPEHRERARAALGILASLNVGDAVTVTNDGKEHAMTVTRSARRSDGAFGSWESTRVTVSLGPGRWSTEITAEGIGSGRQSIRKADS